MGLASFSISLATNKKKVVINNEEVTNRIRRVVVEDEAGGVPRVFLEMLGEGVIEGEGIVTIQNEVDFRDSIYQFLQSLDPGMVEKVALDRLGGFGADETTGQAFLNAISEIVRGNGA